MPGPAALSWWRRTLRCGLARRGREAPDPGRGGGGRQLARPRVGSFMSGVRRPHPPCQSDQRRQGRGGVLLRPCTLVQTPPARSGVSQYRLRLVAMFVRKNGFTRVKTPEWGRNYITTDEELQQQQQPLLITSNVSVVYSLDFAHHRRYTLPRHRFASGEGLRRITHGQTPVQARGTFTSSGGGTWDDQTSHTVLHLR